MEVTLEAIIAIISLVVGLPSTIFIIWKCCSRRRYCFGQATQPFSNDRSMRFESSPYEESFTRQHSNPTFRSWTFVGFQMDAAPYPDGFYGMHPLGGRPAYGSHDVGYVRT
ncbi:ubiquitin-like protein [Colletotrichum kahawae]|uniref:Ubiquitin-like protein n=1 Tax=Colletotrichum kahawae TaxID=34407 RepID=A0AAD9YDH7_COLKA|nr:ubiquitin-like protein [Colletotrichum kahawae]